MMLDNFIESFKDRVVSVDEVLDPMKKTIIFGAGGGGRYAKYYLEMKGKEVMYFCDNDPAKHGTLIDSVEVIPPGELLKHKAPVCIASDWSRDIARQLREIGIDEYYDMGLVADLYGAGAEISDTERWKAHYGRTPVVENLPALEEFYGLLADDASRATFLSIIKYRLTMDPMALDVATYEEYFHPGVAPAAGDVIIDGGAWTGDTAISFGEFLGRDCAIYSFEPEQRNYALLERNIKARGLADVVRPEMKGLWKSRCNMFLDTTIKDSMKYQVASEGEVKIELVALDEYLQEREIKIDLLKLDIEGAEKEAIEGAALVIGARGPKLQICIYHRPDDLWELPLMLKRINPGYEFYLGHHSQNLVDTILYARQAEK